MAGDDYFFREQSCQLARTSKEFQVPAGMWPASKALVTFTTGLGRLNRNPVTGFYMLHIRSHLVNDPDSFMTNHKWIVHPIIPYMSFLI
jgi:hypothetical protein